MTAAMQLMMTAAVMTLLMTSALGDDVWKRDIKIKYFSSAVLSCDENKTMIPDTSQVFWITPDGSLIKENTPIGDMPENVRLVNGTVISRLNVSKASDPSFGYYTCVMIKTNKDILLARWGLNVGGADFSELEEEYRRKAVIGAIAAAVMVVLLGGSCIIWHFRYSKRARQGKEDSSSIEVDDLKKPQSHVYNNRGYDSPFDRDIMESPGGNEETTTSPSGTEAPAAEDSQQQNGGMDTIKL